MFFNDPAAPMIYALSLHDALPISFVDRVAGRVGRKALLVFGLAAYATGLAAVAVQSGTGAGPWRLVPALVVAGLRSEEHTSELQSRGHLVCRLLLEKKNKTSSDDN